MLSKVIMAINYPIVTGKEVKLVSYFTDKPDGGVEVTYTHKTENAQRFGPEASLIVKVLSALQSKAGDTKLAYSVIDAPLVPTELFDDGKDYSTVDIAVQINSSMETSALYSLYKERGHKYKQDMGGNLITVGHLEFRPVCIAPMIQEVDGVRILYVEATSDVVCWTMINAWVKAKVGKDIEIVSSPCNLYGSLMAFFK